MSSIVKSHALALSCRESVGFAASQLGAPDQTHAQLSAAAEAVSPHTKPSGAASVASASPITIIEK